MRGKKDQPVSKLTRPEQNRLSVDISVCVFM